jgi:signal transduction histidine kinase
MLAKMEATQERMDANLKDLKEDIKSSQAEMRSTICAIRSELEGTIQHEMKGILLYVDEKMQNLCRELTETKNTG